MNIRILIYASILALLFVIFPCKAIAEEHIDFPLNSDSIGLCNWIEIDNSVVKKKYFQIINNVDYVNGQGNCTWLISKEKRIGDNTFFFLLNNAYSWNLYLCSINASDTYPTILYLCEMSPAFEPLIFFEIDEETMQLITIDSEETLSKINLKWEAEGDSKKEVYREKTVYSLSHSHSFKILDKYYYKEVIDSNCIYSRKKL